MKLRAATALDAGAMGAILSGWIDETPWMPRLHSRAEDVGFCGHMIDQGWVQVAESADHIDGFIARDAGYVHALYVRSQARQSGVGSALLTAAMGSVARLDLWTFQANHPAQAFYEKHGFRAMDRSDGVRNDEGLPDIRYEWEAS